MAMGAQPITSQIGTQHNEANVPHDLRIARRGPLGRPSHVGICAATEQPIRKTEHQRLVLCLGVCRNEHRLQQQSVLFLLMDPLHSGDWRLYAAVDCSGLFRVGML